MVRWPAKKTRSQKKRFVFRQTKHVQYKVRKVSIELKGSGAKTLFWAFLTNSQIISSWLRTTYKIKMLRTWPKISFCTRTHHFPLQSKWGKFVWSGHQKGHRRAQQWTISVFCFFWFWATRSAGTIRTPIGWSQKWQSCRLDFYQLQQAHGKLSDRDHPRDCKGCHCRRGWLSRHSQSRLGPRELHG